MDITKSVPFSVSQSDSRTLVSQVADGLRQGVVGGIYKPGDVVPSYRDLASMLGVSQIVTKAALRQLADEGFVVSRPRIGSVVRDRAVKQWRGHVVFASPEGDEQYVGTVLATALRNRLSEAGYIFT
ncbi:MAG: winged helix-turn-helix transcriptional regulator [Kiritimatiellae bacterium]|nr:winged helix-turn-helix transcriptional regulator [Kiritimatiellia bacterium]